MHQNLNLFPNIYLPTFLTICCIFTEIYRRNKERYWFHFSLEFFHNWTIFSQSHREGSPINILQIKDCSPEFVLLFSCWRGLLLVLPLGAWWRRGEDSWWTLWSLRSLAATCDPDPPATDHSELTAGGNMKILQILCYSLFMRPRRQHKRPICEN